MDTDAINHLLGKVQDVLAVHGKCARIALIGRTAAAVEISGQLLALKLKKAVRYYARDGQGSGEGVLDPADLALLASDRPGIAIIASDEGKEALIADALPYLTAQTRLIIGGYRHLQFRDELFDREVSASLLTSLANGYPNSLIHIYQCLKNAARLGLDGVVAEFGMFKGGTTMLMSRFIEGLERDWKVYGFDTFGGFPPPKSPLDMYSHPDCVYLDIDAVRHVFAKRNVEIVQGDVSETVSVLADKQIILGFMDTDNYSSAMSILDVIADRIVIGGAIVFDHFAGRNRFLYTLGERLAAQTLLDDDRFFNLHDTGVFLRLR